MSRQSPLRLFMALLVLSVFAVGIVHCGNSKSGSVPATVKAAKY